MHERLLPLVPAIILATSHLGAVESNPNLYQGGGNQHYLLGSLLLDVLDQKNYRTQPEDSSRGLWIRAEYGAKIELDDKIELTMTVAYDGKAGRKAEGASSFDEGEVIMDDAWLVFKRFVHPTLDVEIGRMPVSWNLRSDHGAFLYDSRADNTALSSWDGLRFSVDLDTWSIRPFYYWLDLYNDYREAPAAPTGNGENELYGAILDWQPESAVDSDIFITASYAIEKNAWFGASGAKQVAEEVETWSLGTEWKLTSGWDIYGEFAQQSGKLASGEKIDSIGYYGGAVWHIPVGGRQDRASVGLQYDFLGGNDGGSSYTGFINPHEAMSDTLIVEHERYGELSNLLAGNLEAMKTRIEWVFVPAMNMRLQGVMGVYRMPEATAGGESDFGKEYDLTFSWDYNYYSTISFYGAFFDPDGGYQELTGSDDSVSTVGMSVLVEF